MTDSEEVRIEIDPIVVRLALNASALLQQLSPAETLKVAREFDDRALCIRKNAAGFKRLCCLIGFMHIEAIKAARDQRIAARVEPQVTT